MKITLALAATLLLTLTSGAAFAEERAQGETFPDGRGNYSRSNVRFFAAGASTGALTGAVTTGNGIKYNNGPVMQGAVHVYYIWYGDWSLANAGANAQTILTDFATNVGGSPYFNINTTYGDTTGNVSGSVIFVSQTTDPGTSTSLTDANIATIVQNALSSGRLPTDSAGVYFVLTAPGVTETSPTGTFLTNYCGWHNFQSVSGAVIKYAFVGNATGTRLSSCAVQTTVSPNGNPGADAMVSVIAHELEEATTDPLLNAWYDSLGKENADKCAWTFGTQYAAAGGGVANMLLGSRNFLVQQNWVNAGGGYCALSYSATAPTLTSISPSTGKQGTNVAVTLTGTNFVAGATLALGGSGITVSNLTVVNATTITATFGIGATTVTGSQTVLVKTAGGTSGTVTFNVAAAAPTLTSVSPATGNQGTSVPVTLTGTNFIAGATVSVGGTGVTASGVTVVNATTITATLTIGATATTGTHAVAVTTSGGTSGSVSFTVAATVTAAPTLTSISPATGKQGSSVAVTLTGTNFVSGATLAVSGTGITASSVKVASATSITATLAVASTAATGNYTVSVTTSGGTSGAVGFSVTLATPTLTSITPSSGKQGTSVAVTLTGTNFAAGATLTLGGTGITASSVTVVSATSITATFALSSTATLGTHTVAVTTAGGTSGTANFTVNAPAPTLTSISPASGTHGSSATVTLTGTNFISGASVSAAGTGISVSQVTVVSATSITAKFTLASSATLGTHAVSVTTSGGTSGTVNFTVN